MRELGLIPSPQPKHVYRLCAWDTFRGGTGHPVIVVGAPNTRRMFSSLVKAITLVRLRVEYLCLRMSIYTSPMDLVRALGCNFDYDSTTATLSDGHSYPELDSGALDSASPKPLGIPTPQPALSRPIARRTWSRCANTSSLPTSKALDDHSQTELRDGDEISKCGICFEPAVQPTFTPCCSQLFCADHIHAWLSAPSSLGLCPVCRSRPTPVSRRLTLDITSTHPIDTPFETCDSTQPTVPIATPPSPFSFFSSSSYPASPCSSSMYSTSYYSPSPTDSDAEAELDDDAQTLPPQFESGIMGRADSAVDVAREMGRLNIPARLLVIRFHETALWKHSSSP
ncbi:hypothetical protein R3P38DRAFT_3269347 [Favolaschia claudopus]|uniref:RING-type domain-containing protein n=1 Tax=Favolaschia claudopus TaxID=2862362 RepID=A0AAW0BK53_9AGAR